MSVSIHILILIIFPADFQPINSFKCKGLKRFVHLTHVCNLELDCPLGDDELLCEQAYSCPKYCSCQASSKITCNRNQFTINGLFIQEVYLNIRIVTHTLQLMGFLKHDSIAMKYPYDLTNLNLTNYQLAYNDTIFKIENYKNIVVLDLSENSITNLKFFNFNKLKKLQKLILKKNLLSTVEFEISLNNVIKYLDLSFMKFEINRQSFENFKNLKTLILTHNVIDFKAEIFTYNLINLQTFMLNSTHLHYDYFSKNFNNLKALKVFSTSIESICCLEKSKIGSSCIFINEDRSKSKNCTLLKSFSHIIIAIFYAVLLCYGLIKFITMNKNKNKLTIFFSLIAFYDTMLFFYELILLIIGLFNNYTNSFDTEKWRGNFFCKLAIAFFLFSHFGRIFSFLLIFFENFISRIFKTKRSKFLEQKSLIKLQFFFVLFTVLMVVFSNMVIL